MSKLNIILRSISDIVGPRNICDNVNDQNFINITYKSSLLLGLSGYFNYPKAAEKLGIKTEYLRKIISDDRKNMNLIGEIFHHPFTGNLLSIEQLNIIKRKLKITS